jgi:hypothetical protein
MATKARVAVPAHIYISVDADGATDEEIRHRAVDVLLSGGDYLRDLRQFGNAAVVVVYVRVGARGNPTIRGVTIEDIESDEV